MGPHSPWRHVHSLPQPLPLLQQVHSHRYPSCLRSIDSFEEESFLVIRSLGIQTTTKMRFPLSTHSRFIPASQIDDVFIHEGFKGFQVRHYLAVVVHGEEQLEVVFPVLPLTETVLIGRNCYRGGRYWNTFGGARGKSYSRSMANSYRTGRRSRLPRNCHNWRVMLYPVFDESLHS